MKKTFILLICLLFIFIITSCSEGNESGVSSSEDKVSSTHEDASRSVSDASLEESSEELVSLPFIPFE